VFVGKQQNEHRGAPPTNLDKEGILYNRNNGTMQDDSVADPYLTGNHHCWFASQSIRRALPPFFSSWWLPLFLSFSYSFLGPLLNSNLC
jgi:hypothetical protein